VGEAAPERVALLTLWLAPMLIHDPRVDLDRLRMQIVTGVRRVVEQRARLEGLRFAGLPIQQSEHFLRLLEEALVHLRYRRRCLEEQEQAWARLSNRQGDGGAAMW